MNVKMLIFAVVAVAMAGATAFLIQGWLKAQRGQAPVVAAKKPPPPKVQILVARRNLPAGRLVKSDDMEWREWPKAGIVPAYVVKPAGAPKAARKAQSDAAPKAGDKRKRRAQGKLDRRGAIGSVVRFGIAAGEPIIAGRVVRQGEGGFLAAVLAPGQRAVSVQINATSGIAGFITPGDRVDLILTHNVARGGKKTAKVSETILTDIRVIAIDQRTDDQEGKPTLAKTVTMDVTPKQVEIITLATQIGRVSLSLRSMASQEAETAKRRRTYTRGGEVSRLIGRGAKDSRAYDSGQFVHVLRGTKGGIVTFETGSGK